MNPFLFKKVQISSTATNGGSNGAVVLTTTGDKWGFRPANPSAITRWGVIISTAKDASALVITLAVRPVVGSDTNRAVQDTLTDSATARAAGVSLERRIVGTNPNSSTGSDGSLVNVAALPTVIMGDGVQVLPGQEAVFAVTTAASSTGQGYLYHEYIEYPSVPEFTTLQSTTLNYTVVQL
jgi:hypothetical protein